MVPLVLTWGTGRVNLFEIYFTVQKKTNHFSGVMTGMTFQTNV